MSGLSSQSIDAYLRNGPTGVKQYSSADVFFFFFLPELLPATATATAIGSICEAPRMKVLHCCPLGRPQVVSRHADSKQRLYPKYRLDQHEGGQEESMPSSLPLAYN